LGHFPNESAGTKIGLQVNGDVSDTSEPEIGISQQAPDRITGKR
jgi:hypothetical protein